MGDIDLKVQEILGDETEEFLKNEKYRKLIPEIYAMGAKKGADDILQVIKYHKRFKGGKNEQTAQ